jgi:2,4-dienoyl-CoA reductase-like NADH-dependent reductase (Old Yellow Enzyme family)
LHSFLSPLTNTRSDSYGGQSFENRTRFLLRVVKSVRAAWGDRPLFVRLSATDWAEGPEKDADGKWLQWGIEQTVRLTGELKRLGVDLIDISSGGNWAAQKIAVKPGYQVRLSSLSSLPLFRKQKRGAHIDAEWGLDAFVLTAPFPSSFLCRSRSPRRSRRRTPTSSWERWA